MKTFDELLVSEIEILDAGDLKLITGGEVKSLDDEIDGEVR